VAAKKNHKLQTANPKKNQKMQDKGNWHPRRRLRRRNIRQSAIWIWNFCAQRGVYHPSTQRRGKNSTLPVGAERTATANSTIDVGKGSLEGAWNKPGYFVVWPREESTDFIAHDSC
jgi:hypothetical protein